MKNYFQKFLAAAIIAACVLVALPVKAISPYSSYSYGNASSTANGVQYGVPPVLATNTTQYFTNAAGSTYTVTNADGSIYTNSSAPYFIDCHLSQLAAFEIKVSTGVAGNASVGLSNIIYTLCPAVIPNTNSFTLNNTPGGGTNVLFPVTNSLPRFDTNHLVTLSVLISGVAGMPNDWTLSTNVGAIYGYWLYSIANPVLNSLVTNTFTIGAKNDAP
jgi:hypothetical protein